MARRCALGKRRGYYRALLSDTEDDLSTETLDAGNVLDSEIYEVERLLDKKVVKVSTAVNMHSYIRSDSFLSENNLLFCSMEELSQGRSMLG